jgi:hypothetical protein
MKKTFLRKKIKNKRTLKKRMKGGMWMYPSPLLGPHPPPLGPAPQAAEMNQSESTSRFDLTPTIFKGTLQNVPNELYGRRAEGGAEEGGDDDLNFEDMGCLSNTIESFPLITKNCTDEDTLKKFRDENPDIVESAEIEENEMEKYNNEVSKTLRESLIQLAEKEAEKEAKEVKPLLEKNMKELKKEEEEEEIEQIEREIENDEKVKKAFSEQV